MKEELFEDVSLLNEYDSFEHKSLSHRQAKLLSDLRVELQVVLGTLELTGEQLVDLTPGVELNCSFEANSAVTLCLGEEKIARGQLFIREEELVVEITEILPSEAGIGLQKS